MLEVNLKYRYTESDIARIISALLDKQQLKLSKHGTVLKADGSLYLLDNQSITISSAQVMGESAAGTKAKLDKLDASMAEIFALAKNVKQHQLFFPLNKNKGHWTLAVAVFTKNEVIAVGDFDPMHGELPRAFLRCILDPLFIKYLEKPNWFMAMFTSPLTYPTYSYGCKIQPDSYSCGVHVVDFMCEMIKNAKVNYESKFFSIEEIKASRITHMLALNDPDFNERQLQDTPDIKLSAKESDKIKIMQLLQMLMVFIGKLEIDEQFNFNTIARAFIQSEEKLEKMNLDKFSSRRTKELMTTANIELDDVNILNASILKIWFMEHKEELSKHALLERFFKGEAKDGGLEWHDKNTLISVLQRYLLMLDKQKIAISPLNKHP